MSSVTRIYDDLWMLNIVYRRASPCRFFQHASALSHGANIFAQMGMGMYGSKSKPSGPGCSINNRNNTATIQLLEYPSLIQTWILSAFWSSQKGAGLSETNVYPIPSHGCTKANYPYQNGHKLRVNPTPTSFWQISLRYYPSNYWNLPPFIVCHYPGPLYPFSTSEEKNRPWGLPVCAAHGRWDLGPRSAHTSLKCSLASHEDFSVMVTAGFQHGKKHRLGCGANTCKTAR